ncbi:unnamed protein product [Lepeophtheirus salmonis]|uniref:(salmon louse) hypothetical protein n=1 Tax=Lepeophtheirus salmonis TaxID=72036 RepID=A0A7R8H947_LEPSM|nr:unnamed protein product [Lepeophtheirus salmonis]CAF2934992.1 unnamed protein product [Lepeophtheirus salmonis]
MKKAKPVLQSLFILLSFSTFPCLSDEILQSETVENRRIFDFYSYRDVQILRFNVPLNTKSGIWWFKANHTKNCEMGTVSVFLRGGGYPVVNPDGGKFPENIQYRGNPHNLTFNPVNGDHSLLVPSPDPGIWFMLVYINPIKGPTPEEEKNKCSTWLTTKANTKLRTTSSIYTQRNMIIRSSYSITTLAHLKPIGFSRSKTEGGNRRLRTGSGGSNIGACPLRITAGPRRPPDGLNPGTRSMNCLEQGDICSLKLYPQENSWHYLTLTPTKLNKQIEFAISVTLKDCPYPSGSNNYLLVNRIDLHQICKSNKNGGGRTSAVLQLLFPPYQRKEEKEPLCGDRIRLDRVTLPGVFSFGYKLPSSRSSSGLSYNNSKTSSSIFSLDNFPAGPIVMDIHNDVSNVFEFYMETTDIGGTLAIEIAINMIKLPRRSKEQILLTGCLTNVYHYEPQDHSQTFCGENGYPLLLNVTNDDKISDFDRLLLPFPSSGMWYLTLKSKCRSYSRELGVSSCSRSETPVILSIYSNMCVMGGCGKYGRCYQFFSGGNMFSTCSCIAGYKGWSCTDDSSATSEIDLLAATLLLCLSNLLFLPAVGLAIYRGFYTESFVYFANMIFSTLYHACDQDIFSFCLMKYTVLQFCDFYAATMAYWVTVLAMGGLPEQAKSLLHMVGAVGVALAVEYDRTGVLTFAVPGVIGIIILLASWITHCTSDRSCYPSIKYTCCFFLPGISVVTVGILAFVFLERESNYHFVHSAWHCSMAISILFLLPQTPGEKEEKYTVLDTRISGGGVSLGPGSSALSSGSSYPTETSFKHYVDSGSDSVLDVTSGRVNGGGSVSMPGTLLRSSHKPSSLVDHHHRRHHHPHEPS